MTYGQLKNKTIIAYFHNHNEARSNSNIDNILWLKNKEKLIPPLDNIE